MNTIGAATVFTGRDNSGEAAIVDSTYDTSFTQNLLTQISQDAIRKQQKRDKDLADHKKALADAEYQFNPIGQEEIDNELMAGIDAYEQFLTEQQAAGADPFDPTTEAGKAAKQMRRKLDIRAIQGKSATAMFKAAQEAATAEGNDVGFTTKWLEGYKAVQPSEGRSLIEARAKYVDENPDYVRKAVGQFDFVKPILPYIKYVETPSGTKRADRGDIENKVRAQILADPSLYDRMKKDDDVEKFVAEQTDLIMSQFPTDYTQRSAGTTSSKKSSGGGDKGDKKPQWELAHTDSDQSYNYSDQNTMNAVKLYGKSEGIDPASDVFSTTDSKGNRKEVTGIPQAILKRGDGALVLEVSVSKNGETEVMWMPLDGTNERKIRKAYGDEAVDALLGGSASNDATSSDEWEEKVIAGKKIRVRKK